MKPGTILKLNDDKKIIEEEYWNTFSEFIKMRQFIYKGTYRDALAEIKYRISSAVKTRLIADVPVGAFLSGGIDSSNLVSSLKENSIDLETFSIGFEEHEKNEAHFAKEVSSNLNTKHNEKILTENDCTNIIPEIIKYYDEPFSDPSQIPTFLLSKFARKKVKVAISGDGADELFGGYPRYLNISDFWKRIEKIPSPILKNLKVLANFFSSYNFKMFRSIGKKIRKFSHTNIESLYNDELSRWRPDEDICYSNNITNSFFDKNFNFKTNLLSNYRYLMLRDFITYLPSNLLVKIDRASMANSLEVRNPYLDPSLVKFVWSLPDEFLNKNEIDKSILRDILAEKLSKNIYALGKSKVSNHL